MGLFSKTATWLPPDPLTGTPLEGVSSRPYGASAPSPGAYVDVSLMTPEQQYQALRNLFQNADQAAPAPDTFTPPDGEYIEEDEVIDPFYVDQTWAPAPDFTVDPEALQDIFSEAPGPDIPVREWYNDPQVHGLGVPPGYENDQYFESGHTQIVVPNPSDEQGWDEWSGRVPMARVAQMQNNFPMYSAGVNRGLGERSAYIVDVPYVLLTQQYRDLLLSEIKRRGVHNVVIGDVPSIPYSQQVNIIDPISLTPEPDIGQEGIPPDW
jgi:hypothetical protein